jgi:hypothetical protein
LSATEMMQGLAPKPKRAPSVMERLFKMQNTYAAIRERVAALGARGREREEMSLGRR